MAGLLMDPNNVYIENVNEDVLRDSLESNVEGFDNFTTTRINHETYFHKNRQNESCESLQNDFAKDCCTVAEKQKKSRTCKIKDAVKPKPLKNMIELNKINVRKGQTVNSYSKIHQKKLGKTASMEKEGNRASEESSLTNAAIELRKQLVMDGILTNKDESNMALPGCCHTSMGRDNKYSLDSTRSNETNPSQFGQGYLGEELGMSNKSYGNRPNYQSNSYGFVESNISRNLNPFEDEKIGCAANFQLPPVHTFPTSVQSAPADIQTYLDLSYEKSFRSSSHQSFQLGSGNNADLNNSMTSLASTKSLLRQGHSATYSGLYASAKQNLGINYKPYTLSDYKRLKKQGKPGGLGPNTKSEEHQQKAKKAIRQKEYSVAVKQRNTSETHHKNSKNERAAITKEVAVQKQEANARRLKAMEYAKTVPKPVTSKINQNMWKSPSKEAVEKPQTLLAILQQRHEDEKKAIDATRKNFRAKFSR